MKSISGLIGLVAAIGVAITLPAASLADEPPAVTQVVAIGTNGKTDVLLAEANNNKKIFERLGIKAERSYLQASLAGPNTGTVAVVIEYSSLTSLAAAQEKLANDAEWQKYLDKVTAEGMTVESNSVWVDITP